MRSDEPTEQDNLDRLLDQALSSYSAAAPRPGLEDRVLCAVRSSRKQPRLALWRWALATAASLAAIGAVVWLWPAATPAPEIPAATLAKETAAGKQEPAPPRPLPELEPEREPDPPRPVRRETQRADPAVATRRALPKEPVFPTPAPLTAEERAVLAWVRRDPELAGELFSVAQPGAAQPIQIEAIEIEPLTSDR